MERTGVHAGLDAGIAVTDTLATCAAIPFNDMTGGMFQVPAGSSVTSLTWYAQIYAGAAFLAAYDEDGVALVQTVSASKSYELPSALFGAYAIKAVAGGEDGVIHVNTKA